MAAMTSDDNRQLVNEAVNKGFLSPAQANLALKAIRHAETSGQTLPLREFLLQNKIVSPRRWEEFERHLMTKAAKDAQAREQAAAPPPATPVLPAIPSDELALPCDIAGYRLTEKIGQGGMGSVFKATQKAMRRTVAIKTLSPRYAGDPVYVEKFRNEARAAAALNHPNIIVPIDVGAENGIHFIAMEFIQGESLGQWMDREGRLHWKEALEIVEQVTKGLEYAHKRGIVHRDIKPDNILLDKGSGLAKIADLGLARRTGGEGNLSHEGQAVGTPYYVSPEQARGQKDLDGRADLYSLGATLWHMLAGVPPFEGVTAAVIMAKHLTEAVPDPRSAVADLPEDLVAVVFKLMSKDRAERYENAAQLLEDLEAVRLDQALKHARAFRKGGREKSPLAVPVMRGNAMSSRLKEPNVSRPAASRLRGPTLSRAGAPHASRLGNAGFSRTGGHPIVRRQKGSSSLWLLAGAVVLMLPIIGAVLYLSAQEKNKPEQPATPAASEKSAVPGNLESRKSAEKTAAPSTPTRPPVEPPEPTLIASQRALRDAQAYERTNKQNPAAVVAQYDLIIQRYPDTPEADEARALAMPYRAAVNSGPIPKPGN